MPKGNPGKTKKDITGKKYGMRTVLRFLGNQLWECRCECGHIGSTQGYNLKKGKNTCCPQCAGKIKRNNRNLKMIGKVFGKWMVLKRVQSLRHDKWLCRCECGVERNVYGYSLEAGSSKGCHSCSNIKQGSALRRLYSTYKSNAIKRGHEWNLTLEQFAFLTKQNCYYTGLPPANIARAKGKSIPYIYNGIDRLDNSAGYNIENCVPCKGKINEMKMDSSYDEFIEMCYLVVNEHNRKKSKSENLLKIA